MTSRLYSMLRASIYSDFSGPTRDRVRGLPFYKFLTLRCNSVLNSRKQKEGAVTSSSLLITVIYCHLQLGPPLVLRWKGTGIMRIPLPSWQDRYTTEHALAGKKKSSVFPSLHRKVRVCTSCWTMKTFLIPDNY